MLAASVGVSVATELGLGAVFAEDGADFPTFGELEPLVSLMQETPLEKLQPLLVGKLRGGTELRTLIAAGALANARTFAGQDYIGFHTFMALAPAYEMSRALPEARRALPVLKVLYRNTSRIHELGGRKNQILKNVEPAKIPANSPTGDLLRKATRSGDFDRAESTFAALMSERPGEAFNHLQYSVRDEINVHRVVLAWRSWSMLDIAGKEHAHTLLRQSVRFCVKHERDRKGRGRPEPAIRSLLPKLFDTHKLLGRKPGSRKADDAWVDKMSRLVFESTREQAADAVAAALAEGFTAADVGEAISLAANRLVLNDRGRKKQWSSKLKPTGSVHGDSVGVHASDAANAWRNIARVSNDRNALASLIIGAYHTAGQRGNVNDDPFHAKALETVTTKDRDKLLSETKSAIRGRDQARASALVQRYGELGHPLRPIMDLFLGFAVSEDGALHAEKYYHTVEEEFGATREKFRWRQPVALARVTASEYGRSARASKSPPKGDGERAAGYEEACGLLKVDV
jgi:hypothetical protein